MNSSVIRCKLLVDNLPKDFRQNIRNYYSSEKMSTKALACVCEIQDNAMDKMFPLRVIITSKLREYEFKSSYK